MLQLGLQRIVCPGKGLQDVPQGMFPTAPGSGDVVEILFEGGYFLL